MMRPPLGAGSILSSGRTLMSTICLGRSTLSFIRSISVVPPATKRTSADCCAVDDAAPNWTAWSTVVGRLNWNVSISLLRYRFQRLGLFTRGLYGCDDVGIGATTADIAVHGLLDVLICGTDGFFEESNCRHDLARGTVAALVSVVLDEGSLHRVKVVGLANAFDCGDLVHRVHDGEREAGIHAAAVDMYRTGAALSVVATFLCARHVQVFPQAIEQPGARADLQVVLFAVDAESDRD